MKEVYQMKSWIRRGRFNFDKFKRNSVLLRSTKKDPELEISLFRDKRWTVNNRIKNIILQCPSEGVKVEWLQKKFRYVGRLGSAMNYLTRYPCCYDVYLKEDEYYCRLTNRLMSLVEEEKALREMQEPVFVERLAKLLMMSCKRRLKVRKIGVLQRNFGFPDDFIVRIVPKYPDLFKIVNHTGKFGFTEIVLTSWRPDLAVSAIEKVAQREGRDPCFSCRLPSGMVQSCAGVDQINSTPYISPYTKPKGFLERAKGSDKRTVGIMHELLSLTLWRRASVNKLSTFRKDLGLSDDLHGCLLKYPGIFYVTNRYDVFTVLLREAYDRCELIDKDPLVIVKEKVGELLLIGYHGKHRKHRLLELKKHGKTRPVLLRGKKRPVLLRSEEKMNQTKNASVKQDDEGGKSVGIRDPEERKRFYNALLEDDGS